MAGLYIHIPFCASRCIYCGFYSTLHSELQDQYVDALCREMELRDERPPISTIYLGGGTPSQLSHEKLDKLFTHIYKLYSVDADAEVTMECNPDDIHDGMFRDLPVNRVSMGAQTFSDQRLRFLHRRHTAEEVDRAVALLHKQGLSNISIDLMFGFPNETIDDWKQDIHHVLGLEPQHISAYGLMYEEGTPLYRLLQQNKVQEIDEELSLAMYDMLVDCLTAEGYEHYEFSNFALPGFRSRHNSSYWHNIPYIGLGAAAHSYNLKTRSWNIDNIKQYIEAISKGTLPSEEEVLDEQTKYNDLITTALRTKEGIDISTLQPSYRDFLLRNAKPHLDRGFLLHDNNHIRFSRAGIKISNSIMADLMKV
ncbi:MAG: radical SAM family heme chaperone HemW [Prevotella sp.]|jgi:putative oxygen-independent coproporphyrinogen III oxidase